ncbi:sensor histidine kinase [Massilia sp. S19_KUP03_FR1]|uniref:sensor histidine kinase n=1 Tax=Massilia sp. S19_KUP03_FR1 TaxID=3025503 RepID=UPI002FCDC896
MRDNWPRWPRNFSLMLGLVALTVFACAALFEVNSNTSPRDYAEGVPGNYVVLRSARWLDLGTESADAPSLSPLPAAVMEARGVSVVLPHHLPKDQARASISWYSMSLSLPAVVPGTPAAGVCVPRWSSSASVWLDGKQLVASAAGVHGMHDWSRPQYIGLPPELALGTHRLDLRLRAMPALAPGLSEIWFGDGPLVRRACAALSETREQRILGSGFLIAVMGLAGLAVALLLRDVSAACFAAMALLWVTQLAVARGVGASLPEQTWTLLFFATRTAFAVPMLMFCLRFSKSARPRLERLMLLAYGTAIAVLLLLPAQYWSRWLTSVAVFLLLSMPYFLMLLVRHALRRPSLSAALLVVAIGVILVSSVLDLLRWMGIVPFSNASLSIMTMPLLSLAFGALLVERLVALTRREMNAAKVLRMTVAQQAAQIAASVAASKAQEVRDPLSHAGRSDDDPVSTLLESLRGSIAPVLAAQGITLDWQASALPADFLPGDAARLHLLRLLQETFTNIVKHAHASAVRFRAHVDAEAIWIDVVDDGCGIPAAPLTRSGLGLVSMRQRAEQLGATLDIAGCAPGTRVGLRFARRFDDM